MLPVEHLSVARRAPSTATLLRRRAEVAVAAGRTHTLPMLTGVRLEIEDDLITLAATDRYPAWS